MKTKCQKEGCRNEGVECILYDHEHQKDLRYSFCVDHAQSEGFCYMCGEFWGGIESFEFNKNGLCDNCQSELDAELADDWEYDEIE